jgi:hypothetical protein
LEPFAYLEKPLGEEHWEDYEFVDWGLNVDAGDE